MAARYIISDLHFGHEAIIKYCDRPFENADEMNEYMIEQWNNVVDKDDKVFVLGDFGFGSRERLTEIVSRLNGSKYLILGNHDKRVCKRLSFWREIGFKEVYDYPIIIKNQIILSHEPIKMSEDMPYMNIHGHIHNNPLEGNYYNVCVEPLEYIPLNLDALITKLRKKGMIGG